MTAFPKTVIGVVLVLIILALGNSAVAAQGDEEDIVNWVRENAVQLDYEDWHDVDAGRLSFLDEAIEGKRIVYLGVSDHWVREKYDYRLMLIHYLFGKGYRYIGMEMNYSDGERIDRYLATGDETHLQKVALYGYTGGRRDDRDDKPAGFPGMENPSFREAFLSEERRFLAQLRKMNESLDKGQSRLHWFGFDVGLFPSVGYEEAETILSAHSQDPVVREATGLLKRVPGETRLQEAGRLEELAGYIAGRSQRMEELLGESGFKRLSLTVKNLADTYRFCDAAKEGPRTMKWLQGLHEREADMIWLMDEILEDLPAGAKVILVGHNLHLSKNSEEITLGPVGSPAPALWKSVGTHLAERFPGEIYSIWMLYDHGRHGTVLSAAGVEDLPSNPATVEHLMAEVGSMYMLQLSPDGRQGPFRGRKNNFLQNGSIASGALSAQADAVFFVREVSELKER